MVKKHLFTIVFVLFGVAGSCQSYAGEWDVQVMRDKISGIGEELRTTFAKAGVELAVWNLFQARAAHSPMRYEGTRDFQEGFKDVFALFQKRLRTSNLRDVEKRAQEFDLPGLAKAYQRNRDRYLEFVKSSPARSYFPPGYPEELITQSQFYFSLILFDVDKGIYGKAKRFTYIFPFCD